MTKEQSDLNKEINQYKIKIMQLIGIIQDLKECVRVRDKDNAELKLALKQIKEICENGVYDEYRMPLDEFPFILDIIDEVINE